MAKDQLIAGIDIGGSKIRTVIAETEKDANSINVIGVGIADSFGIRKGNIVDINETIKNISQSLESAERMAGESVDSVYISVSGNHLKAIPSKGVVAISGQEIVQDEDNAFELRRVAAASLELLDQDMQPFFDKYDIVNPKDAKCPPIPMGANRAYYEYDVLTGKCQFYWRTFFYAPGEALIAALCRIFGC